MRKYQPIWERVKSTNSATLVAPIKDHRKIIQAVRKEKCKDLSFSLYQSDKGVKLHLISFSEKGKTTLTFSLKNVRGIKLGDL